MDDISTGRKVTYTLLTLIAVVALVSVFAAAVSNSSASADIKLLLPIGFGALMGWPAGKFIGSLWIY